MLSKVFTISGTSPNSASTAVLGTATDADNRTSMADYDFFTIDADLVGATGGTLDVYLQRQVADNLWRDWCHFAQLAAGASAVKYTVNSGASTTITTVGGGTDASPGVALAAATFTGGHPGGGKVRAVCVAGASTSAGAAVVVRITGWVGNI